MSVTVFGIKNCDRVRAALKALDARGTSYVFHDFRKDGLSAEKAQTFIDQLGREAVLNKRGTTYRGLSDADKARAEGDGLAALLAEQSALIKRPVWDKAGDMRIGFKPADRDTVLNWAEEQ